MSESPSEASAVIWNWQDTGAARPTGPAPNAQRLRGALQGGLTLGFAALLRFFGFDHVAVVAGTVGSIVLLSALVSPTGLYAAIQRAAGWLAERVGAGLNFLLLGGIFALFFVPFGLLFRRGDRDALKRRLDPEAESYWVERTAPTDSGSRRSQY